MAGRRVHVVMPADLVERVDACRGGVSRGEWVRRAVERALELGPGRVGVPEARPVASRAEAQAASSPAPAEQPGIDERSLRGGFSAKLRKEPGDEWAVSRSEMFKRVTQR